MRVNSFTDMIDFTRAFDSAWERMMIILFRPFDPTRWFFIGFNAFLALLAEGSASFNRPVSFANQKQTIFSQSLPLFLHSAKLRVLSLESLAINAWFAVYLIIGVVVVGCWLLLSWVGCRGEFLFVDNIVRNRAAISEPWRRYASQGNKWFLFHLGLTLLTISLTLISMGSIIAAGWSWISNERNPQENEIILLGVLTLLLCLIWIVYGSLAFIFRSFAVPLMFKQTFGLRGALSAIIHLIFTQPLSMAIYVLASFALAIAAGFLSVLVACVTCCCIIWPAFIPFMGSLVVTFILAQLILPILVYCRCFQIDCLAQFGPQYDVWSVDVPPSGPLVAPPFSPPPPLG